MTLFWRSHGAACGGLWLSLCRCPGVGGADLGLLPERGFDLRRVGANHTTVQFLPPQFHWVLGLMVLHLLHRHVVFRSVDLLRVGGRGVRAREPSGGGL